MRLKPGTARPCDIVIAAATGAATDTAINARPRAQPPAPRISVAALAIAQGAKTPAATASTAMPATTGGARSSILLGPAAKAAANTTAASARPRAISQTHEGWFDTGSPQTNFGSRPPAVKTPQYPPTVPSSLRFQG